MVRGDGVATRTLKSDQPILHYNSPELYAAIRELFHEEKCVLLRVVLLAANPDVRTVNMPLKVALVHKLLCRTGFYDFNRGLKFWMLYHQTK